MKMFTKSALMLGLLLAGPSFAQSGTGSQTGSSDPKTTLPTPPPDSAKSTDSKSTGSDSSSRSTASDRSAPGSDDSQMGSDKKKAKARTSTSGSDTADPAKSDTKPRSEKP